MINSNHTAMLEHGTVYLKTEKPLDENSMTCLSKYNYNKYSKCFETYDLAQNIRKTSVTTNFRVIIENNWYDDLKYLCEPTKSHERRYTFKFTTDRGVSHELVRHRVFSFAQESTRYCNYTKGKFGRELTFIIPSWYDKVDSICNKDGYRKNGTTDVYTTAEFVDHLEWVEANYIAAIKAGLTPQEARSILPNCLKTEICMTGFESDWLHFFDLRYFGTTGAPHPDMKILTEKAKTITIKYNICNKYEHKTI